MKTNKIGLLAVAVVLALTVALVVNAQEKKAAPATTTIKGEVIDVYCYSMLGDSGKGPAHKDCAKKCIEGGLPVGILEDGTNKVILAVAPDHKSAKDLLLPYAAEKVEVTGKSFEKGGITVFEISGVKKLE